MSKPNKVNKGSYVQRGRLTPDEMAREQMHQAQASGQATARENVSAREQQERGERESTRQKNEPEESA